MRDLGLESGQQACIRLEAYAEKVFVTIRDLLENIAGWLRDNGDAQGKKIGIKTLDEIGNLGGKIERLPITEDSKKMLESIVCGKYQMACSFEVNKSVTPPQHYVFFQAKDAETMTKAFKELATKTLQKEKDKIQNKEKSIDKTIKDAQARSKNKRQIKEKNNNRGEISK